MIVTCQISNKVPY